MMAIKLKKWEMVILNILKKYLGKIEKCFSLPKIIFLLILTQHNIAYFLYEHILIKIENCLGSNIIPWYFENFYHNSLHISIFGTIMGIFGAFLIPPFISIYSSAKNSQDIILREGIKLKWKKERIKIILFYFIFLAISRSSLFWFLILLCLTQKIIEIYDLYFELNLNTNKFKSSYIKDLLEQRSKSLKNFKQIQEEVDPMIKKFWRE